VLSKNLINPLEKGEQQPYLIKVHEARVKMQKRIKLQEIASAQAQILRMVDDPSMEDYEEAYKQLTKELKEDYEKIRVSE
jgi:hypothetical protein